MFICLRWWSPTFLLCEPDKQCYVLMQAGLGQWAQSCCRVLCSLTLICLSRAGVGWSRPNSDAGKFSDLWESLQAGSQTPQAGYHLRARGWAPLAEEFEINKNIFGFGSRAEFRLSFCGGCESKWKSDSFQLSTLIFPWMLLERNSQWNTSVKPRKRCIFPFRFQLIENTEKCIWNI